MKRRLRALLLCLVCIALPVSSTAAINTRTNLFLEMMLTMMEIMGMIDRDHNNYYNQPYPVINQGYNNQWQNAMQMLALQQMLNGYGGSMGGINPLTGLSGLTAMNSLNGLNNLNGLPFTGSNQSIVPFLPEQLSPVNPQQTHWIEGKWRTSDGMIMEVRQGQFKMYYLQSPREVRGGLIRIKDKWLAIYESSHNITRQFEFAYKDDQLVLKDTSGNMMLFKRMTNWAVPARR